MRTAGDSVPLTILFSPSAPGVTTAEVFSNLNRRDRAALDANGDGIEDGIVPPDGGAIAAGDDSHYYKAYTMSPAAARPVRPDAQRPEDRRRIACTARYKVSGNTNWFWYSEQWAPRSRRRRLSRGRRATSLSTS